MSFRESSACKYWYFRGWSVLSEGWCSRVYESVKGRREEGFCVKRRTRQTTLWFKLEDSGMRIWALYGWKVVGISIRNGEEWALEITIYGMSRQNNGQSDPIAVATATLEALYPRNFLEYAQPKANLTDGSQIIFIERVLQAHVQKHSTHPLFRRRVSESFTQADSHSHSKHLSILGHYGCISLWFGAVVTDGSNFWLP